MPRGDGHCLVIPKKPSRNIFDADADSLAAVMRTTQKLSRAVMKAFSADGVTVQQFNEPAGGQVVFHLHVHILPRFEGVALRPHTGQMEKPDVLAANAEKIKAALAAGSRARIPIAVRNGRPVIACKDLSRRHVIPRRIYSSG